LGGRRDRLTGLTPRLADDDEILRVHTPAHLRRIAQTTRAAPVHLDPDTYASEASHEVARLAAGASIDLALAVARGDAQAGFAAVRPPGHHAESGRAMGFCLFNSIAIAVRALQAIAAVERVMVLDWDVHHGNGTQHLFESDPSVLYLSTHQFPFYPGTGDVIEAGTGRGEGTTVNAPMPAGCGDAEYIGVFQRVVVPVVRAWRPEIILVSCGFDAHTADPLASMDVSASGFGELARITRALAEEVCDGRVAAFLEGGYGPVGLRDGTAAVLDAWLAEEPEPLAPTIEMPAGSTLRHVVQQVANVQRRFFSEVGSA
jgi:acetoin utilization deacetylase AcuC-like enzyme